MRTADLAGHAQCSLQLVRNLERDGVLPAVPRSRSGYRLYGDRHLHLLLAYRALSSALSPAQARSLLRALDPATPENAVAALDAAHALLHRERLELAAARRAARLIAAEPVDGESSDGMGVAELAGALGIRPSTLRHWEAEGLIVPDRWSSRRIRRYSPAHIRDARIVWQLRTAGHGIDSLRSLMPALRSGREQHKLDEALDLRQASITTRSLDLIRAARSLHAVLEVAQ
jgi:DNA-binding transcriptional MerR regulator